MSGSHKEFPKKAVGVQLGLAALVGIGFLAADKPAAHASAEKEAKPIVVAAAKVLAPIGKVEVKAETGGSAMRSAEDIYTSTCGVCHDNGVAGAPKLDDKASWETRLAGGYAALVTSSIKGKGGMPARGGNPDFTDPEMELVVGYMIKKAGIDLVPRSAAGTAAPAAKTEEHPTKATIVEETKDAVTETAEVVTDKVAEAKETVAETVETVTEKAIDTKDAVVETVTDKVDEAKEAVTDTVEAASDKVEEVKTDAVAAVAATATATKVAVDHSAGEKIYKSSCFACHDSGVAGSPKFGDKAAWAPRIATGKDQLYASSINGKGAMPAKGGNTSIADDDIKAAVDYMVSKSQ